MTTDMTTGNPSRVLVGFFTPMLLSVVFQQLYNLADSVIAGRFIGAGALAAVGASYSITMIFMAIALGSNIGAAVIISQLFGAKRFEDLKCAISTSVISVLILSLLLTVVGMFICSPLLRLMNTPQEIFEDSAIYLYIYTAGLIFLFLYNISTGIFTALGDSRTPLYLLIFSSVGNIILDILFVTTFAMGVAGVAWATLIAQGVSAIAAFLIVIKRISAIQSKKYKKYSFAMLGRISKMAIPSILQQSFVSVGMLFIQGRVNYFGSDVIAGYSSAIKLNNFTITVLSAVGNAASSFVAQNFGATKKRRIIDGMKAATVITLCVALPFFIAFFFLPDTMISIFTDKSNSGIFEVGRSFLRIISPFYFIVGMKITLDGSLRGVSRVKSFTTTTFADLLLRVILAFIFSYAMNSEKGIWLSWPVGWSIGAAISLFFYIIMYKQDLKGQP